MRYSPGWLDFINSKASHSALISAVNTLEGSCRQYLTCRTPGTYTLKPVPWANLELSVKTRVVVSYFSELINGKQPEDKVGQKRSSKSTIAISSTTFGINRNAQKLYSVYDLPDSIPNESTHGYPFITLPLPRSAKVLSLHRNASPFLA
jgi:hypothetical protein